MFLSFVVVRGYMLQLTIFVCFHGSYLIYVCVVKLNCAFFNNLKAIVLSMLLQNMEMYKHMHSDDWC